MRELLVYLHLLLRRRQLLRRSRLPSLETVDGAQRRPEFRQEIGGPRIRQYPIELRSLLSCLQALLSPLQDKQRVGDRGERCRHVLQEEVWLLIGELPP